MMALLMHTPCFAQTKPLIETVEIPAGSFYMGSEGKGENFDEAPVHKVNISNAFRMGITEVTNAQYEQFRPEHKQLRGKDNVSTEDDDAVVNVSYQDAVDFCKWLSEKEGKTYRLPTEAEWEYACRADTTSPYFWGSSLNGDKANCDGDNPCGTSTKGKDLGRTTKVGNYDPNRWGLHDMHGNVCEWCADWYDAYDATSQSNPKGPNSGTNRVLRGGSWGHYAGSCRSANRNFNDPTYRYDSYGFRLVLGR